MQPQSATNVEVRVGTDDLPPGVEGLVGHEVVGLFEADDENALVVGVVEDGRWVSALLLLIEGSSDQTVGSIRQLIIPPAQRGRGIAGRLIRRAMAVADERGATRLRTTAGWGCPDHAALYRRMKFEPSPAEDTPYLFTRDL